MRHLARYTMLMFIVGMAALIMAVLVLSDASPSDALQYRLTCELALMLVVGGVCTIVAGLLTSGIAPAPRTTRTPRTPRTYHRPTLMQERVAFGIQHGYIQPVQASHLLAQERQRRRDKHA